MKLKKEYRKSGYILTYLKSNGRIHLYEKVSEKEPWMENDPKPHWEVVMARKVSRAEYRSSEWAYPRDSDWGVMGWTLMSRERAEEKFNELCGK